MAQITDHGIIDEFIAESREHLNTIEPDLLSMEKDGEKVSIEAIHRVFRAAHSIKGASGFHGFSAITELSHAMEGVLDLFQRGKAVPDPENVDALLAGMDKLRAMLDAPHVSDRISFKDEIQRLKTLLGQHGSIFPAEPRTANKGASREICRTQHQEAMVGITVKGTSSLDEAHFDVEHATIRAIAANMEVYAASVDLERDLKEKGRAPEDFVRLIDTYGQCIVSNFEAGDVGSPEPTNTKRPVGHVLFASILEPEIMGHALDIPADHIHLVEREILEPKEEEAKEHSAEKAPRQAPLEQTPDKPLSQASGRPQETIRIGVDLVDRLMNLAGELVLGRNQLRQLLEAYLYENPKLGPVLQNVDNVTTEIQEDIMKMRLQPSGKLFNRFPRLVRDLCRQLGKEADLAIGGAEVELDKSILEALSDPLTHLVRNGVDHAIELPEVRQRLGKPRMGQIRVGALQEGGQVIITIEDDGAGIDVDRVIDKALSNGAVNADQVKRMSREEKMNLIFLPGLSTAKAVTDVSGRGVGMDVVRNNIEQIGGHVDVESERGQGTKISIRLPLTLAIIPSLIVGAGKLRFAIPQVKVRELVSIPAHDTSKKIEKIGDAQVLRLRGRLLPLVSLAEALLLERTFMHPETGREMADRRRPWQGQSACDHGETSRVETSCAVLEIEQQLHTERRRRRQEDINVVVCRVGPFRMGLIVDQLFDSQEIVVKPLSNHIKDCRCFAGATIMGDGTVAMILDPSGIADFAGLRFAEIRKEERRRNEEETEHQKATPSTWHSFIMFNNASEEVFALPLDSICRLEVADAKTIERTGDRDFVAYRGQGLPLLYLDRILPVRPFDGKGEEIYFIIPKTHRTSVGIVASRILDTVQGEVSIQKDAATPGGLLGSAMVDGHLTMFLDVNGLVDLYERQGQVH